MFGWIEQLNDYTQRKILGSTGRPQIMEAKDDVMGSKQLDPGISNDGGGVTAIR